jgi:hypothetical protein
MHGQLLAAFKGAAPSLGLSLRHAHAIDWLFKFTQPQDWGRGGRPIVWPSASLQRDAFGLSDTRVKALNRELIEAGLITMKDSPNGKRYGRRDPKTRLIAEAYGFDLSPIAARHAEFVRLAEQAKTERAETGRLRRRATIARNGITQILETAAKYNFEVPENPDPDLAGDRRCGGFSAWRAGCLEIAVGRGVHRHGPREGGDRDRDRLSQTGGAFPLDAGRVFPRHGGEGASGRTQPRAHGLGLAPSSRAEIPPRRVPARKSRMELRLGQPMRERRANQFAGRPAAGVRTAS